MIVGDLAFALRGAYAETLAAESRLVDLLYALFPSWRLLFPSSRSWVWWPPDEIEVFNAYGAPATASALVMAGFVGGVTIHDHPSTAMITCKCTRYLP